MWSENFSAVREIFFFQKGDLHNSFGRSVHMCWAGSVATGGVRHRRTSDHAAPAPTTPFIVTKQRMFKLSRT